MWQNQHFRQANLPPFALLDNLFHLSAMTSWPNAAGLNQLARACDARVPEFVCQSELSFESDYYEQIIFRQQRIPTRPDNWHDLFNGLIWLMFPKTKGLLNALHMEDIEAHGLSPRTKRRNHITHFDECGVVLVTADKELGGLLAEHQWQTVFWENRHIWQEKTLPLVFGHANLEMLLSPFLGLTGKWMMVEVEETFFDLSIQNQLAHVDAQLHDTIKKGAFSQSRPLLPLPLLGIPGWSPDNEQVSYYQNRDYFRPKRD